MLNQECTKEGNITFGQGFTVAYFGLLRHSELVSLQKDDIEISTSSALKKNRGGKGRQHYVVDTVEAPYEIKGRIERSLHTLKNKFKTILLLLFLLLLLVKDIV